MSGPDVAEVKDGRRGRVFTLRLEPGEEETLRARMAAERGGNGWTEYNYVRRRDSLGAFIVKWALKGSAASIVTPPKPPAKKKAPKKKPRPRRRRPGNTKPSPRGARRRRAARK